MKTFRLPKEFALKWVEELKTTGKTQGEGKLVDAFWVDEDQTEPEADSETYCCLGVAAVMCGLTFTELIGEELLDGGSLTHKYENGGIPPILMENTSDNDTKFTLVGVLTRLNDGLPPVVQAQIQETYPNIVFQKPMKKQGEGVQVYSFPEIAKWLETNVEFY